MIGRFRRSLYVGRMTEYLSFVAVAFVGAIVAALVKLSWKVWKEKNGNQYGSGSNRAVGIGQRSGLELGDVKLSRGLENK